MNELDIILSQFNLTKEELIEILDAFQTKTMNNLLRSSYKSPRFEEVESEDFYTYRLYEISSIILKRISEDSMM